MARRCAARSGTSRLIRNVRLLALCGARQPRAPYIGFGFLGGAGGFGVHAMGHMSRAMRGTFESRIGARLVKNALPAFLLVSSHAPAAAQDFDRLLSSFGDFDRHEFALLALTLAILGFSVVCAI